MLKRLRKLRRRLRKELNERYGYLRYRDNWHKHSALSALLCAIGRHDYEFEGTVPGRPNIGRLVCFYCEARKQSAT